MIPARFRLAGILLVVAAMGVLGYLAERHSPFLKEVWWMPGWLGRWSDMHGVFRNFVAFFAFGVMVGVLVSPRWPYALGASVFATGLEVAQLWIPSRIFDLMDILNSVGGIAAAWVVVNAAAWLGRRFFGAGNTPAREGRLSKSASRP